MAVSRVAHRHRAHQHRARQQPRQNLPSSSNTLAQTVSARLPSSHQLDSASRQALASNPALVQSLATCWLPLAQRTTAYRFIANQYNTWSARPNFLFACSSVLGRRRPGLGRRVLIRSTTKGSDVLSHQLELHKIAGTPSHGEAKVVLDWSEHARWISHGQHPREATDKGQLGLAGDSGVGGIRHPKFNLVDELRATENVPTVGHVRFFGN